MITKEFQKECDEWLNPMGYSLHANTQDSLMYSCNKPDADWPWPIIECWLNENKSTIEKRCQLIGCGQIGLIHTVIGPISFRHPNINRFVAELRYASNCIQSMSTNPLAKHYVKNLMAEME